MSRQPISYLDAGVDVDAKAQIAGKIQHFTRRTYTPRVIERLGSFAGLYRLDYDEKLFERNYRKPVLVACTDGVGTKVEVARMAGKYDTIGSDAVAMNVNDLAVMGAETLFFLDYMAVHKIEHERMGEIIAGMSEGCREAGCALLGGETADMPAVYSRGKFDLAGFAVGVVEKNRIIDGGRIRAGDVVIGLSSSGLHTNGFSLVRTICFERLKLSPGKIVKELDADRPLSDVLLEPHRIYASSIFRLTSGYRVKKPIHGMAHITGGGLAGNIDRVLPKNCNAEIDKDSWPRPPIFKWLMEKGPVQEREMWRVFNMGIGFVLVVNPNFSRSILARLRKLGEAPHIIGRIKKGEGKTLIL
jgi:phosphoribosylformylglycinamidine cyclo-ligase